MEYLWIRLTWVFRSYLPHGVAAAILFPIYRSLTAADLSEWATLPYLEFLQLQFDAFPPGEWWLQNLLSLNVVTKAALVWAVLLGAWYFSDLFTTGRRPRWQLVAAYGSTSRVTTIKVWMLLSIVLMLFVVGTITTVYMDLLPATNALRAVVALDLLSLTVMMVLNRTFEAYKLLQPEREAKREKRREKSDQRDQQRRQQKQMDEERRRQLSEMRQQLDGLMQQTSVIDAEIRTLRGSNHDTHLIEERAAELLTRRNELQEQIRQVTTAYPDRV